MIILVQVFILSIFFIKGKDSHFFKVNLYFKDRWGKLIILKEDNIKEEVAQDIPTKHCPEHQTVAQDGADHDEAEGYSPHCLGYLSLHITQSCVVYRRELSPELIIDERKDKYNLTFQ